MTNNQLILTQIEEVPSELGQPDCKMVEPFVVNESTLTLSPWMMSVTRQNTFMIHSDKILTMMEPNDKLKDKYKQAVKG
jgi:hypothetical protein